MTNERKRLIINIIGFIGFAIGLIGASDLSFVPDILKHDLVTMSGIFVGIIGYFTDKKGV